MTTRATKKRGGRKGLAPKRYTPAERQRILAAAKREGLSGVAAAKKFGIAQLTFYNWRNAAEGKSSGRGSRQVSSNMAFDLQRFTGQIEAIVRQEVRARLAAALPGIVEEEVRLALRG